MKYLAISTKSQCWAKAATIAAAKRGLKKEGGDPKSCTIYQVTDDYYIDEMGTGHGTTAPILISGPDARKEYPA